MKTETIICACGESFKWEWEPDGCDWFDSMLRPKTCPACSERIEAEVREKHRIEVESRVTGFISKIMARVADNTPTIFRATNTGHQRFNIAGWEKVKDWQPTAEKPWLGMIGATGTCKSRMGYLLCASVIEAIARERVAKMDDRPPTFDFVASYEITDAVARLNATDFREKDKARDYLAELRRVDFLLIDDLGKGRLSPAVAAELFALIDHRYSHALPMIWTANSTPEEIASQMTPELGATIAGRLNDSSRILKFK